MNKKNSKLGLPSRMEALVKAIIWALPAMVVGGALIKVSGVRAFFSGGEGVLGVLAGGMIVLGSICCFIVSIAWLAVAITRKEGFSPSR